MCCTGRTFKSSRRNYSSSLACRSRPALSSWLLHQSFRQSRWSAALTSQGRTTSAPNHAAALLFHDGVITLLRRIGCREELAHYAFGKVQQALVTTCSLASFSCLIEPAPCCCWCSLYRPHATSQRSSWDIIGCVTQCPQSNGTRPQRHHLLAPSSRASIVFQALIDSALDIPFCHAPFLPKLSSIMINAGQDAHAPEKAQLIGSREPEVRIDHAEQEH